MIKQLNPMISRVRHGYVSSISGYGYSPREEKLSRVVPPSSKAPDECTIWAENLNPMVVFVRHEDSISSSIITNGSWPEELPTKLTMSSETSCQVSFWPVHQNFMPFSISDEHLKQILNKQIT